MVESRVWTLMQDKHYVTLGPFPELNLANDYLSTVGLQPAKTRKKRASYNKTVEAELNSYFPILMRRAQAMNDVGLIDDLFSLQHYIRDENTKILRAQRPISEVLQEVLKYTHAKTTLSQNCLICNQQIKEHGTKLQKKHFALLCNLLERKQVKRELVITK